MRANLASPNVVKLKPSKLLELSQAALHHNVVPKMTPVNQAEVMKLAQKKIQTAAVSMCHDPIKADQIIDESKIQIY